MSFFDELFTKDDERIEMRIVATDAIAQFGLLAESELLRRARYSTDRRARRICRMAADEVNWRNSREWLPDYPPAESAAAAPSPTLPGPPVELSDVGAGLPSSASC